MMWLQSSAGGQKVELARSQRGQNGWTELHGKLVVEFRLSGVSRVHHSGDSPVGKTEVVAQEETSPK